MRVEGLKWLGIRTQNYDETVGFFRDVLGLEVKETQETFVGFRLPNGDEVEVFSTEDADHSFFTTGPVGGFAVADVEDARRELEAHGIAFLGDVHGEAGSRWTHLRGPDGNVYELTGG